MITKSRHIFLNVDSFDVTIRCLRNVYVLKAIIKEWNILIFLKVKFFKRARERGASVVRDIWEEADSDGKVRMATVKTVSERFLHSVFCYHKISKNLSTETQRIQWSNEVDTRACFCPVSRNRSSSVRCWKNCKNSWIFCNNYSNLIWILSCIFKAGD